MNVAGKTVLCKEKATQLGNENGRPVYFLCLTATEIYSGKPDGTGQVPYIFDLLLKSEFEDTKVKAMDVFDLRELYKKKHPTKYNDATVYDLVKWFAKENKHAHFIVDECPLLEGSSSN